MTIEELTKLVRSREGSVIPLEWAAWFALAKAAVDANRWAQENNDSALRLKADYLANLEFAESFEKRRDVILEAMNKITPAGVGLYDSQGVKDSNRHSDGS